jgi:hypothetical protein
MEREEEKSVRSIREKSGFHQGIRQRPGFNEEGPKQGRQTIVYCRLVLSSSSGPCHEVVINRPARRDFCLRLGPVNSFWPAGSEVTSSKFLEFLCSGRGRSRM